MKKIFFILTLIMLMIACKKEKKPVVNHEATDKQEKVVVEKPTSKRHNNLGPLKEKIKTIFDNNHVFSNDIQIEKINVHKGEKAGTFDFVFYFSDSTNVDSLKDYYIAVMLYPENKNELPKGKDKKRGFLIKTIKGNIKLDGNKKTVYLPNYIIAPHKIKNAKIYLYNKAGMLNPKKAKLLTDKFSL